MTDLLLGVGGLVSLGEAYTVGSPDQRRPCAVQRDVDVVLHRPPTSMISAAAVTLFADAQMSTESRDTCM